MLKTIRSEVLVSQTKQTMRKQCMANYNSAINRKCIPGNTYGYLTVVKFITTKNMWECTCVCGKTVYRQGTALLRYKRPNCGCKKGVTNLLPDQMAHKRAIISTYKRHAKSRNYEFKLTDAEAIDIILKNCYYCGIPPSNKKTVKPSRKLRNKYNCTITTLYYNGIDRLDNSKGYIRDNCVPCCNQCNWSKKDLSLDDWKTWIMRVSKNVQRLSRKRVGLSNPKQESPSDEG